MDTESDRKARFERRVRREEMNLFGRMSAASTASLKQGQKCLKQAGGLSVVEWRVLWDLNEAGPLTIREMATIQRTDHSLLSRWLPQMRDKGFLSMRKDSADRRQVLVALEDAGRAAFEAAAPIMKRRREIMRETFTAEEIALFVEFIDRYETMLTVPVEATGPEKMEPAE